MATGGIGLDSSIRSVPGINPGFYIACARALVTADSTNSVGNLANVLDDGTLATEHEMEITGLTPGTTVFYSVGSISEKLAGDDADHYFVMPPAHGTEQSTRVWVLGDSGTTNSNARDVRNAYNTFTAATHTDLWLMLGDNAYNNGTDTEYQAAVFDTYPAMLRKSALWPTVENHDDYSTDFIAGTGGYYEIFTLPDQAATNGTSPGVNSGTEAYYSFDFANIHFIVLESDETNWTFRFDMVTWLAADLAATTAVWVVAFWHHPSYTMGATTPTANRVINVDTDDDNDGLPDLAEEEAETYVFDPDTDGDGIRHGLDTSLTLSDIFCAGDIATIDEDIGDPVQCAAPVKVIIDAATDVLESGRLLIVTPKSEFMPGFGIRAGGEVTVHSEILP